MDEPDVGLSSSRWLSCRTPAGMGFDSDMDVLVLGDAGFHWHRFPSTSVSLDELMGFSMSESKCCLAWSSLREAVMATMGVWLLALLVSRIMRATSAPLICGSLYSMNMMSNLMSLMASRTAS